MQHDQNGETLSVCREISKRDTVIENIGMEKGGVRTNTSDHHKLKR